ncbi:MAG: EAL domain-containing protein, partial [Rhodanobacteraceae bacterium]|nr:EAL domain-containing protein [Rhodanobacteraceae bacterium]
RDLESNPRHRAIVRTIVQFARDLGLSLVAEGVETEGQAALLREYGCELAQGYLYARPMPAEQYQASAG